MQERIFEALNQVVEAKKTISIEHCLDRMRLIYAAFILLLALTSAQCQQTAEDWYNEGRTLYNQSRYDEAIEAYDEAIKLNPNYAEAWYNKGVALDDQGKEQKALQAYDEVINCYNGTKKLDPILAMAWYSVYNYEKKNYGYKRAGIAYDEAFNVSREAIKQNPDDAATFAEAWVNKGKALAKHDGYAIDCYDEAIRINPNYAEAWFYKGNAYQGFPNEDAIKCYAEAIRLDPNLTDNWFIEGKFLVSQHDQYNAVEAFRRFLEIDPQNATGWNYLGESLYAFDSDPRTRKEAIQAFDKSIELDPQNAAAWCNKGIALRDNASYWRSKLFDQYSVDDLPSSINKSHIDGMYDEAIEAFNRSIEIDPKNAITWLEFSTALTFRERMDEAKKAYNESLKIEPRPVKVWLSIGARFASEGRYEDAVRAFDKAIDLDPLSKTVWSNLQDALNGMNAYEEAYHIEPILSSPVRSERTEAAYLDHENRNKRYLALDNPTGHISEWFSFEGWRADFEVNQTNYTIEDLSDFYSGTLVALNGQETSIYYTIIRITSPEGVGNLKLAIMPVDQEEFFLSDPISMAPWYNKYEIKCRQEDNSTVALAMTIYSGYKSDPFENIKLTNTSGGYHWDTVS